MHGRHSATALLATAALLLLLLLAAPAAAQKTAWSFDNSSTVTIVSVVHAAGAKNVVVVGAAASQAGSGPSTIAGYDAVNGTQLWAHTVGTASYGALQFVVRHGGPDSAVVLAFFSSGAVVAIDALKATLHVPARRVGGGASAGPVGPWQATPVSSNAAVASAAVTYAATASNDVYVISMAARILSVKLYAAASEQFWRNASGAARLALVPGTGDVLVSVSGTGVGRLRAGVALWTNTQAHAIGISYGVAVTEMNPEVGAFASANSSTYEWRANGLNLTDGASLWSHSMGGGGDFSDAPVIDFKPTITPDGRHVICSIYQDNDNYIVAYLQVYDVVNGTQLFPDIDINVDWTSPVGFAKNNMLVGDYMNVKGYLPSLDFAKKVFTYSTTLTSCLYVEATPLYIEHAGVVVAWCGGSVFAFEPAF